MNMFSTKYANTIRTVSGASNPVFNNDVVLEADTSTSACGITLDLISQNYWNTNWKLYIIDKSNNAATNNITINAGSGQKINGASSIIISTNGGGVMLRVLNNTNFIAISTVSGGGITQAYTTIQDEGSSLPQRTKLNFIGTNVTAADNAGNGSTDVTITGGSSYYQTIYNHGVAMPQRASVDYEGNSVTLTDTVGGTVVTINAYNTIQYNGSGATQRSILNFIGDVDVADDSGSSRTNVTISGIQSITNASLLTLISSAGVVAGKKYLVTDALYSQGGVIVMGVNTKSITTNGAGLFLNADYQGVGDYSGVSGFNLWKGIWSTFSMAVSVGDVVIYNNTNYKNLTGSWGSAPSGDTTNWAALPVNITSGYIQEIDYVTYSVTDNKIVHRQDKRNNYVDYYENGGKNTMIDWQWGRDNASDNVIKGETQLTCINSCATIKRNIFENATFLDTTTREESGYVLDNVVSKATLNSFDTRGLLSNNVITSGASVGINLLDFNCEFRYNVIESNAYISFGQPLNGGTLINKNTISAATISFPSYSSTTMTMIGNVINQNATIISTAAIIVFTFSYNSFSRGTLTFAGANGGVIQNCSLLTTDTISLPLVTNTFDGYICDYGYSNWPYALDISNPSIYNSLTLRLTIPTAAAYAGVFTLSNVTGSGITYIVNAPTGHDSILQPDVSCYFDFNRTAVASGTANCILLPHSFPTTPTSVTYRANGSDSIVIRKFGTYNAIVGFNIWR